MLELTVRLVVSLTIVVGLLLVLARVGQRKFRGSTGAMVQVVHRQPLSRTSAVAVVAVGSRVLVLGTTEQQVSVLAELDPDELDLDLEDAGAGDQEVLVLPRVVTDQTGAPATPPALVLASTTAPSSAPSSAPTSAPTSTSAPKPAARVPGSHRAAPPSRSVTTPGTGALAGSVLSPQTWRQAFSAVSNRTPRGAARKAS